MWIILAFISAALLGFYDASKKSSLRDNAVIPVLFLNTVFCAALLLPLIILSHTGHITPTSDFYVAPLSPAQHRLIVLKSAIVLSSWVLGYFAIKHLPLTIVGSVNATRPVLTIVGALLVYREDLNAWQWGGSLAWRPVILPAEPLRQQGGHTLQPQRLDLSARRSRRAWSCERTL